MKHRIYILLSFLLIVFCLGSCSLGEISSNEKSSSSEIISSSETSSTTSSSSIISSSTNSSTTSSSSIISSSTNSSNTSSSTGYTGTISLKILAVNDIHGALEKNSAGKGGISNMASVIDGVRNENSKDDVVLIANGDMFQGSYVSNMSHGLNMVECMNLMNFDCMGIGNHEFDWGLPEVLNYFDGDSSNGEANFPLLNTNLTESASGDLVGASLTNVLPYTIVEREGVKIGIISLIDDLRSSILTDRTLGYVFNTDFANRVTTTGQTLKDNGADIIIVNIHGGNSSGVNNYQVNTALAQLKLNGKYLVDAMINGHTHTEQRGTITRTNGVAMPVIQTMGNGKEVGEITLTYNYDTDAVTATSSEFLSNTTSTNYNSTVETKLQSLIALINNPIISVAGISIGSTYTHQYTELQTWAGNVMRVATDADIAIGNDGGLRSPFTMTENANVTEGDLYNLVPFDNAVVTMQMTGANLKQIISDTTLYYSTTIASFNDTTYYKVAMIDYVFQNYTMPAFETYAETGFVYRQLLIDDVKLNAKFDPITDPTPKITSYLTATDVTYSYSQSTGGTFTSDKANGTYAAGTVINLALTEIVTNYEFLGFYANDSLISTESTYAYTLPKTSEITITAKFESIMTISDCIALADGTVCITSGTVVAVCQKSYLIKDSTGYILCFTNAVPSFVIGDIVRVNGTLGSYNSCKQFSVNNATYTATKIGTDATYTAPTNPTVISTSTIDTVKTSTSVGSFVQFSGTLTVSGSYYNIALTTNTTGSIIYPAAEFNASTYSSQSVTVTGYYVYNSGNNKYFNIIITSIVLNS